MKKLTIPCLFTGVCALFLTPIVHAQSGTYAGSFEFYTHKYAEFQQNTSGNPVFLSGHYGAAASLFNVSPSITVENFTATVPRTGDSTPFDLWEGGFVHHEDFTDSLNSLNSAYLWSDSAAVSFELVLQNTNQRLSLTPKPSGNPTSNYTPPSFGSSPSAAILFEDGATYSTTVDVPEIVGGVWFGDRLLVNTAADTSISHNSWYWNGGGDSSIYLSISHADTILWEHMKDGEEVGNSFLLPEQTLQQGMEYQGHLDFSAASGTSMVPITHSLWVEGAPPQTPYGFFTVASDHTRSARTYFTILAADFDDESVVSVAAGADISAALYSEEGVQTLAVVGGGESSQERTLALSMTTRTVAQEAILASDVFSLSGTEDEVIVLQLSYDETVALALFDSEENVRLGWLDEHGQWVNAVDGNDGAGTLAGFHLMGWEEFLTTNGGAFDAETMLGAHGTDTQNNTVWAVINHNSDFAAVPEPSAALLLLLAAGMRLFRRRRS